MGRPEVRAAVGASWLPVTFDAFTADPDAVRVAIGRLSASPGSG